MNINQVSNSFQLSIKSARKFIQLIPINLDSYSSNSSSSISLQLNDSISIPSLKLYFKNYQGQILMISGFSSSVLIIKDSFFLLKA